MSKDNSQWDPIPNPPNLPFFYSGDNIRFKNICVISYNNVDYAVVMYYKVIQTNHGIKLEIIFLIHEIKNFKISKYLDFFILKYKTSKKLPEIIEIFRGVDIFKIINFLQFMKEVKNTLSKIIKLKLLCSSFFVGVNDAAVVT
jgi:hypothetical protein